MLQKAQYVPEEALLGEVKAEAASDLIQDDHQSDASLEAGQYGRGDEICDKPQAQGCGDDQQQARQCRQL